MAIFIANTIKATYAEQMSTDFLRPAKELFFNQKVKAICAEIYDLKDSSEVQNHFTKLGENLQKAIATQIDKLMVDHEWESFQSVDLSKLSSKEFSDKVESLDKLMAASRAIDPLHAKTKEIEIFNFGFASKAFSKKTEENSAKIQAHPPP